MYQGACLEIVSTFTDEMILLASGSYNEILDDLLDDFERKGRSGRTGEARRKVDQIGEKSGRCRPSTPPRRREIDSLVMR